MSEEQRKQGGLSVKTLLIAGAASAVAAIVIPALWRPGTVFAAAMTPIVVAVATELLRRPVDTVGAVAVRRTARGTAVLERARDRRDEPFDPLSPPPAEDLAALPGNLPARHAVHRRRSLTARQWTLALATGLVAFAAVALLFTASELIAGDRFSGGSSGGRTTFFGGEANTPGGADGAREESEESLERRPEEATPTRTPTATATPTPTVTPEATATPVPTATPPAGTEPAPAAPAPTTAP